MRQGGASAAQNPTVAATSAPVRAAAAATAAGATAAVGKGMENGFSAPARDREAASTSVPAFGAPGPSTRRVGFVHLDDQDQDSVSSTGRK